MGNLVDFSRPSFGGPPQIPKDNTWTGITWNDFVKTRVPLSHIPLDNGYIFGGYELPESVIESILCRLPRDEILKCNLVCRLWKDLITRKSFWKKCFEHRGLRWETVPPHIREKPEGWIVLCSQFRYEIFTKNYILNPSGHRDFESWKIFKNGGDKWRIEETPVGCDPLSDELFYGIADKSCFVTSYQWCCKYTVIDLWKEGLNPTVMRASLPLQIKCSQMYTSRFDCGAVFRWELRILDSEEKIIREHKMVQELPPSREWETAEHSFKFKKGHADFMSQVRFLVFIHEGRDSQFWKGHYGMKLARAGVTVQPLDSDPEEDPELEAEETAQEDSGSDIGMD